MTDSLRHLAGLVAGSVIGRDDITVDDVHHDSRRVTDGSLFVAIRGFAHDGHAFVGDAVARGAAAVAVEEPADLAVPQVVVPDGRRALGPLAAAVHGNPSHDMDVIGVTGTNGKTTVTRIIESIARVAELGTAVVGTLGMTLLGEDVPIERTTPEASDLQRMLRTAADRGVAVVAMEVSSHALALGRVDGTRFAVGAFTNLSQDHLDFHHTMDDYFAAKASLFAPGRCGHAVVWIDDPAGARIEREYVTGPRTTVGLSGGDVRAVDVDLGRGGSRFRIVTPGGERPVGLQLAGDFNVANALVAAGCALAVGIDLDVVVAGLERIERVPGRFETVAQRPTVIVDYAHTPDAIRVAVESARRLEPAELAVVVGAGGDRDRDKRPAMGAAAAAADVVYVTSDNPRSEEPLDIVREVAVGVQAARKVLVADPDRAAAIDAAVAAADPDDIVLVLGKGHEQGQEISGRIVPFDDRAVAAAAWARHHGGPLDWDLDVVAAATGGTAHGSVDVKAVVTDSRRVGPGALFVALRGESFDGHDFTVKARAAGAAAVLVEPGRTDISPRVEVADTLRGLRDLAVHRRRHLDVRVAAITGSTGKTSTKDLLAAALGPGTWASPQSYNNEVGVPLTVLSTPATATDLVAEVGSRGKGHIAWLAPAVGPDVAVITNIGLVHLETFGSPDAIVEAKWELVEALGPNGVAVLPVGDGRLDRPHRGATVIFGAHPDADVYYRNVELDDNGRARFMLITEAGSAQVKLAMAGAHQPANAAAATAAALAMDRTIDEIVPRLEAATGSRWRMEVESGRFTVVNDAYNANPDSVESALRTVAAMPGRHIAVLGIMAELGDAAVEEHERIGRLAAGLGFDPVIVVGDEPGIARGAGAVAIRVTPETAFEAASAVAEPGSVVLVKASRVAGLEALARRLTEEAGT